VSQVGRTSRLHSSMVGAGILLSRIAGFIRDRTIAHFLGVSIYTDAVYAAARIPNLLQNLLGEGALSASFIPVYARLLSQGREEDAGRVAGAVAGLLTVVASAFVVLGVVFAEPITAVVAPGWTGERFALTVTLVRIFAPGVGFLVLSAWCLGVLNSHRKFFLSYVAPVLWNAAQIATLWFFGIRGFARADLAVALAWGMFAGAVLQFLVQLPPVLRVAHGVRPSLDVHLAGVRRVLRNFGPVVAGRGAVQLLVTLEQMLASLLAGNAVAILNYATRLHTLPISLFGMSVAAASLPDLSSVEAADRSSLASRLAPGLSRIAFFVVPTAAAFVVVGDLIVATVYQSGEFGRLDTMAVWLVLASASVGLLANTSSRLLQSVLYGAGDTRRPALYAVARLALAAALGAVLMLQFDRLLLTPDGVVLMEGANLPAFTPLDAELLGDAAAIPLGAVGLALAGGMSSWLEYGLLRRRIADAFGARLRAGGGRLSRIAIAVAPMALTGVLARPLLGGLPPLAEGPAMVTLMGAVYLASALALGLDDARALIAPLRRRRHRRRGG
jgi:putative peptidoglycan lipid II flippase